MVITFRLLRSEKIDSFDTRVIPVIIARSIYGFVLNVASVSYTHLVDNIPRDEKLLLLAGGLNPDNVRMAIEAVHPDGVDVSSGVENDDKAGKNPEKIHDFVAAVKS